MKKMVVFSLGTIFILCVTLAGCAARVMSQPGTDQTLIIGRSGDSALLDPANTTDGESLRVTGNIFDTLVAYKPNNTEIKPALASSWATSADGRIWTFALRDGVKFQDGTDFNADAVVFNIERWWDRENPYHTGGNFAYFQSMFGGFKGDKGCLIQGVKALDSGHVQITLKVAQAPFLANMAMAAFGLASPAAIKKYGDEFGRHPVGTGPFIFQEWKPSDSITLVKNRDFWQPGLPRLDKLVFRVIPDNTARLMALQSGEIDMMDGLNPADAATVRGDQKLKLIIRPSMNIGYLAFNTSKKPFDNVLVRQALSMAIDKRALIDAFFSGMALPAKNDLPPSIWGYNDDVKDYPYDITAAKKLLALAGYAKGFTTDLWAMPVARPYMPQPLKMAESIQADLAKIGVKVRIVTMDWATYLKRTANGEHTMALYGWSGDNGDPDNFLYVYLDKDNADPPAATNISMYKNERVHELLVQAQTTLDQNKRAELYKEVQQIAHDDAPIVPLVHSTPLLAAATYVKGYIPHPTTVDRFTKVYIKK